MMPKANLTRVVQLTLQPQHIDDFKAVFVAHQQGIAGMQGCISLQAYQDVQTPSIFFTISQWESTQALDNYRYSTFFKTLWSTVKPMFAAKAIAHSMLPIT
jgi:quinol monooxygenase YgiN